MAQNTELTRLTVTRDPRAEQSPAERLLKTLQSSMAGQFELFGELGRGESGRIVFLAREIASGRLVALQLTPTGAKTVAGEDYWFEIVRTLDANVPAPESDCPACGKSLGGWARFCRHCGVDLSGVAAGGSISAEDLLRDVRAVAAGRFTILGQMDRSEGGGTVYFARELATGQLVALRLQRERTGAHGTERYNIGVTGVLRPAMAAALGLAGGPEPAKSVATDDAAANAKTVVARPVVPPPERLTPEPTPTPDTPAPVAAAPAPIAPTRQVVKPLIPRWRPTRDQAIAIGTAAVALIALVWFAATRNNDDSDAMILGDPALIDTTAPIASAMLNADSGDVEIGGQLPRTASLQVDGKAMSGPAVRIPAGEHTFSLTAPGYRETTQQLTVKPGQQVTWTPQMVRLSEATGNVVTQRRSTPRPTPPPPPRRTTSSQRATPGADRSPRMDSTPPVSIAATTRADSNPALTDLSPVSCGSLFARLEWPRALAACDDEAKRGSAIAQRTVGTIYERGLGVTPNPRRAAEYYAKAAEAGDAIAQFRLGALMFSGTGIRKDEKQALVWIRRAADQQHLDAMYALGQSLERGEGTRKNESEALALFMRTAELGYPRGQTKLGSLYAAGHIVPRDDRLSVSWFRKAADQGYAEAQYRLGDMYARGLGVAKSEAEARKWFQRAAAQGHERARKALR